MSKEDRRHVLTGRGKKYELLSSVETKTFGELM